MSLADVQLEDAAGRPVAPDVNLESPIEGFSAHARQPGTKGLFRVGNGERREITEAPYDWVYRFSVDQKNRRVFVETGRGFLVCDFIEDRRWTFPYFDIPENAGGSENLYYYVPGHDFLVKQGNHLDPTAHHFTGYEMALVDYDRRILQQIDLGTRRDGRAVEPMDVACSECMIGIVGTVDGRSAVWVYAIEGR
jgi:hypothetical protein